MKNNKGFSLVELIIVIAIMAILVGVLAPQLIKYIEKTNVSNDVQVCDTLRTAIQTAMADSMIITDTAYTDPSVPTSGASSAAYTSVSALISATGVTAKFQDVVETSIGCPTGTAIDTYVQNQCKSSGAKTNTPTIYMNKSSILVFIPNTDMSGNKQSYATPSTSSSSCVYAGPAATFNF